MKRNCIFTGKEARCKRRFLNKNLVEDEFHNWSLSVPCSIEYDRYRGEAPPNNLEIDAFIVFWGIEVLKLKQKLSKNNKELSNKILELEGKLKEIQEKINLTVTPPKDGPTKKDKIKEKQIETAIVDKEIAEVGGQDIDDFFENMKKKMWN